MRLRIDSSSPPSKQEDLDGRVVITCNISIRAIGDFTRRCTECIPYTGTTSISGRCTLDLERGCRNSPEKVFGCPHGLPTQVVVAFSFSRACASPSHRNVRVCDSQHRRTTSTTTYVGTTTRRSRTMYKEEIVSSSGYVCTYILTQYVIWRVELTHDGRGGPSLSDLNVHETIWRGYG